MLCLLSGIPVVFVAQGNEGFVLNTGHFRDQNGATNDHVKAAFFSDSFDLLIHEDGYSYQLHEREEGSDRQVFHRVDIDFLGSASNTVIIPGQTLPVMDHRFVSDESGSQYVDVHYYAGIICQNVYPGVDLEFLLQRNDEGVAEVKFNYILQRAADISLIRFRVNGADHVKCQSGNSSNAFVIETSLHPLIEKIPRSFILRNGEADRDLNIRYVQEDENTFSFTCDQPELLLDECGLVIDPTPAILWGTYFGGSGIEWCNASATDGYGYVYLCGNTSSASGIATSGAWQGTYGGSPFNDIFVAKFDSNGARIWSTYIGGSNEDQGLGIDTDAASNVYICGSANSSGLATAGAHQSAPGGGSDLFIAKLLPTGMVQWSTYIGGTQNDLARSIHVSGSNLYIAGQAISSAGISSAGAHQPVYGGGSGDGVIVKMTAAGSLLWSSYYGGSGTDYCTGVATDGSGNVYVSGTSNSASGIATGGVHQSVFGGSNDGFLVSFTASGLRQWATYIGGNMVEILNALAVNSTGQIVVGGQTYSSSGIATAGAGDVTLGGGNDGFVNVFSNSGIRIAGSYLGGNGSDNIYALTLDIADYIYVAGNTASSSSFATTATHQSAYGGGSSDGLLAQFNSALLIQWASYYGGSGDDYIRGVGIEATGELYIAGFSSSSSNIATSGVYQPSIAAAGVADAFLSQFNSLMLLLPIGIEYFSAENDDEQRNVLCSWKFNGINEYYTFRLERSLDRREWELLNESGCMCFDMNSESGFMDDQPLEGICYYRLKVFSGSGEFIEEKEAAVHRRVDSFNLFPMPARAWTHLSINSEEDALADVSIINAAGKLLFEERLTLSSGMNFFKLDLSALPAGNYLMHFSSSDGRRLVKPLMVY